MDVIKSSLHSFVVSERFKTRHIFQSDLKLCTDLIDEEEEHKDFYLFSKVFERLLSALEHDEFEASRGYCKFVVYTCLAASNKITFVDIMAHSFEKLIDLVIDYPVYQEVDKTLFINIIDHCLKSKYRIQNVLKK